MSFFIKGVPVKAILQALGSTRFIWMASSLYWLRWASSIRMKILGSVRGCLIFLMAVANLLMTVVMTASVSLSNSSTSRLPVVAFSTCFPHLRKVLVIWSSKSVRSVTKTIRGLRMLGSCAIFWANITMVSDLPLPWVCHTTPPLRRPASMVFTRSTVSFTVKYCW